MQTRNKKAQKRTWSAKKLQTRNTYARPPPGKSAREIGPESSKVKTPRHEGEGIWFKDDEDFKAAMNFVAAPRSAAPECRCGRVLLLHISPSIIIFGPQTD